MNFITDKGQFLVEEYDPILTLDYLFIYDDGNKNKTYKQSLGKVLEMSEEEIINIVGTTIDTSDFKIPILFKIY